MVDLVWRARGEWIKKDTPRPICGRNYYYVCSVCGFREFHVAGNFCCMRGSDMRETNFGIMTSLNETIKKHHEQQRTAKLNDSCSIEG